MCEGDSVTKQGSFVTVFVARWAYRKIPLMGVEANFYFPFNGLY